MMGSMWTELHCNKEFFKQSFIKEKKVNFLIVLFVAKVHMISNRKTCQFSFKYEKVYCHTQAN